jgi:signal-transduction protein with cAMP-binding, CBS, and nucleotidyltransferase domain
MFSQDTKVQSLARAPLFSELSKDELAQLAKATEDLDVPEGRVLCREGELAQEFFVIIEGEADVTKGGEHLTTLKDGDFFGEIALIVDIPRTATVTAKTPLRFFVLSRGPALSASSSWRSPGGSSPPPTTRSRAQASPSGISSAGVRP